MADVDRQETALEARPGFVRGLRALAPGVALCFVIAFAATFLSEHYGGPVMLFALLLGMALHFLSQEGAAVEGIEFSARRLLRIGIALLGARITVDDITALGAGPALLVVACVCTTLLTGLLLATVAGRGWRFGILVGGSVGICGASAALAISAVLPPNERLERDTLFTVVAVTALSTLAMIVYPVVYAAAGFDDVGIGILLGATIHDVAQVVGAGYAVSETTGDVATYVKLLRVALLPAVVVVLALVLTRTSGRTAAPLPWFAVAFFGLMLINSAGWVPAAVVGVLNDLSRWLLVVAIVALGLKTSLQAMAALGWGHLAVVVGTTLALASLATTVAFALWA
ncbi:MAG: putative sulfate exporter family transporter [Pseudomonadota bacterium]